MTAPQAIKMKGGLVTYWARAKYLKVPKSTTAKLLPGTMPMYWFDRPVPDLWDPGEAPAALG